MHKITPWRGRTGQGPKKRLTQMWRKASHQGEINENHMAIIENQRDIQETSNIHTHTNIKHTQAELRNTTQNYIVFVHQRTARPRADQDMVGGLNHRVSGMTLQSRRPFCTPLSAHSRSTGSWFAKVMQWGIEYYTVLRNTAKYYTVLHNTVQ